MINIADYVEKFKKLPPFAFDDDEIDEIKAAVKETFDSFKIGHSPYFCSHTIFHEDNKEWHRMLYICDDEIPLISFYSVDSDGIPVFVDCYGNVFHNELKLIQSIRSTKKYYKYNDAQKVFSVTPISSDNKFLESIVENFETLGDYPEAKMADAFFTKLRATNSVKALKMIKNFYRFFIQLSRNVDRITELKIGNSSEILTIKLFESKRQVETIIEVNLKKLSTEEGYLSFVKLMWRIDYENREEQAIKEESIPTFVPQPIHSMSTDNYVITMNRYFLDSEDFMARCNAVAERISEKLFRGSVTLSQFKNIVLWLRERLSLKYNTEDEVINEYRCIFFQLKSFDFKGFKYLNIQSAVCHIYKHFDDMINMACFANYKRVLDLRMFENSENIIGSLISQQNTKLLNSCFSFYFNIIPAKLFKPENLVYWQSSGAYQSYNYSSEELVGARIKFGDDGLLSIATMFAFSTQGDMDLGDGQRTDFKNDDGEKCILNIGSIELKE